MLDVIVFLLFVPVCPAEPAKIGRKELEIILPYALFCCAPQATLPLLDLPATCITCALNLGTEAIPLRMSGAKFAFFLWAGRRATVRWRPPSLTPLLPLLLFQGGFYQASCPGKFVLGHLGARRQPTMTV